MDMTTRRLVIVPDAQAWALAGVDLHMEGIEVATSPETALGMLVPVRVPAGLRAAVHATGLRIPGSPPPTVLGGLAGVACRSGPHGECTVHGEHAGRSEDADHGGDSDHAGHAGHRDRDHDDGDHTGHGDHGGGDQHDDMMAIVGEPSDDGLIMEDIAVALGPLGPPLPGGLVTRLELDGDVVVAASVTATLRLDAPAGPDQTSPDGLCPLSWRAVLLQAAGGAADLAGVEVERALSHAAWMSALATVIGHAALGRQADLAIRALVAARGAVTASGAPAADALASATGRVSALARTCLRDRGLRLRLEGVAVVAAAELDRRRIGGPVARAAGLPRDARMHDPRYAAVGFEPVLGDGSDALTRTRVRAEEAVAALELAGALLGAPAPSGGRRGGPAVVEGPRGPLHAMAGRDGAFAVVAPGHAAQLELAAAASCGFELASALAGLVSFDLSPWRVAS